MSRLAKIVCTVWIVALTKAESFGGRETFWRLWKTTFTRKRRRSFAIGLVWQIFLSLGLVAISLAKDGSDYNRSWFVLEEKHTSTADEMFLFVPPAGENHAKSEGVTAAAVYAGCKRGNLTITLLSEGALVRGPTHPIVVTRETGPSETEIWHVGERHRVAPDGVERGPVGLWNNADAGKLLDSLAGLTTLQIEFKDDELGWVRNSTYKIQNLPIARLRAACPW